MIYKVDWDQTALEEATRYLDDTLGLAAVMDAVDCLADEPRPGGSLAMGQDRYRMRIGRYRLYYDVNDLAKTVTVVRCGRVT